MGTRYNRTVTLGGSHCAETNPCVPQVGLEQFVEYFGKSLFLHWSFFKAFDVDDNLKYKYVTGWASLIQNAKNGVFLLKESVVSFKISQNRTEPWITM